MSKSYKVGDAVQWKWGSSTAFGIIEKISNQKTEIQSKNSIITRNGTMDNPAVVIKQDNGTKLIKLGSELQ